MKRATERDMSAIRVDGAAVIPVRFNGLLLFWLKNSNGSGALAPRAHLDKRGHMRSAFIALTQDSYAHVLADGAIMRYGTQIGTVNDLEFVPPPADMLL